MPTSSRCWANARTKAKLRVAAMVHMSGPQTLSERIKAGSDTGFNIAGEGCWGRSIVGAAYAISSEEGWPQADECCSENLNSWMLHESIGGFADSASVGQTIPTQHSGEIFLMKGLLKRAALAGLATCTLAPFASSAQAAGLTYGIGLQAGTLGIGPDFNVGVNKYLGFDLGLNTYSRSYSSSTSNINYDFKAKLNTVHLLANVYPFGGVFHLSAGLVSNGNKFDLTGSPSGSGTYDVNGTSYTAAQVGTLTGKVTFPGTAAYVGMGWGLSYDPGSHWGFNFDLGALYQGKPKVSLTSSGGTLSTDATFQQNLAAEQKQAQDKLSGYQWYPVARLGLYFKF